MDTETFEIGARTYRLRPLHAFAQLHVARRLAPVVGGFGGSKAVQDGGAAGVLDNLGPGLEALARLPDADVDYILNACLATVDVKVEGDRGWAKLCTGPGVFMFEDVGSSLPTILHITWKVLEGNLQSFFNILQSLPGRGLEARRDS